MDTDWPRSGAVRLAVVIPWRDSGDIERAANLTYVAAYYSALDIGPVVVVHDGKQSGPFNRSAAYNRGLAEADADVYLWNEADSLIPLAQIKAAVALALEEPGLVIPFTERHELSPVQTKRVLAGATPFTLRGAAAVFPDKTSIGQAGVTSRHTIDLIGGQWDEDFSGWGYDDNAMHHLFAMLAGPSRWVNGKGIHLYHKPGYVDPTPEQAAATERNAQRLERLRSMSSEELHALYGVNS